MSLIETVSGRLVDVLDPNPDDIVIDDIAWSLSRLSRFTGHTITKIPPTVGQHSLFVAQMLLEADNAPRVVLYGLLHDAAESYVGDCPAPTKHIPKLKVVFDEIEQGVLDKIFVKFAGRLPATDEWAFVKYYDKRAQFIEAHNFMVSRGRHWINRENYDISLTDLQEFPEPKPATTVYHEFMDFYSKIISQL